MRILPRRVLLPLAIVVLSTLAAGWHAWRNRSEETSRLTLTSRELTSWRVSDEDDSGISLSVHPQMRFLPVKTGTLQTPWLDRATLIDLGFDCHVDPREKDAAAHYQRQLPRDVFVVFEYEGPAWQAYLDERTKTDTSERRTENLEFLRTGESRLVPIDASRDAATLRQRYAAPGRYLITRARVRVQLHSEPRTAPRLDAYITDVLPREVYVPRPHSDTLKRLMTPARGRGLQPRAPYFDVDIHYGHHFEPWVTDVRPHPQPASSTPQTTPPSTTSPPATSPAPATPSPQR